jgi:hypothetical protein
MISPHSELPVLASDHDNGYMSSIIAWLRNGKNTQNLTTLPPRLLRRDDPGSGNIVGQREFIGFKLYDTDDLLQAGVPTACQTALGSTIKCSGELVGWQNSRYFGLLGNTSLTDMVCDTGCGTSLKTWFDTVSINCRGYNITGAHPTLFGGTIWQGYNETCLKDQSTSSYCNGMSIPLGGMMRYDD